MNTLNLLSDEGLSVASGYNTEKANETNNKILCALRNKRQFNDVNKAVQAAGYQKHRLKSFTFDALLEILRRWPKLPMFVSLWHTTDHRNPNKSHFRHLIGIIPLSSNDNKVHHHIVDGVHPQLKTFPLTKENLEWCGDSVSSALIFFPSRKFGVCQRCIISVKEVEESTKEILLQDKSRSQGGIHPTKE
jgi:hypothetical protein